MKAHLTWRAHSPAGWLEHTQGLGPIGEWSLLRLLDRQWLVGSIPASPVDVLALLRAEGLSARLAKEAGIAPLLERYFPVAEEDPSRRQNRELTAERTRAHQRAKAFSERGKAGAEALHSRSRATASTAAPSTASSNGQGSAKAAATTPASSTEPKPKPKTETNLHSGHSEGVARLNHAEVLL